MERDRIESRDRDRDEDYRDEREVSSSDRGLDVGQQGMTTWSGSRDPWLASHFDFMRHLMREMNRMIETFPGAAGGKGDLLTGWPPIEVTERDNLVVIRAEMPGMRREDVKVRAEGDSVVIEGERKTDRERRHEGYHESEWSYGRFSRRVMLPAPVDPNHVNARYDNGILEVTLEVPPRSQHEVPITGAESRTERGLRGALDARNREQPRPMRP